MVELKSFDDLVKVHLFVKFGLYVYHLETLIEMLNRVA